jgi:nucleotide-binding universal stress UspA family protein
VRLLATVLNARVKLLRAVPVVDADPPLLDSAYPAPRERLSHLADNAYIPIGQELARTQAENYLQDQLMWLRNYGIEPQIEAVIGRPDEVIAQVASELENPMIVMATHGYSGLRRWMLGSVTDKVIHTVSCPVLVVRAGNEDRTREVTLRRILLPLDGSALARQALPLATEVAIQTGAKELMLLTAVKPIMAEYAYGVIAETNTTEGVGGKLLAEVADVADTLTNHGVTITSLVANGFPAEVVVDTANDQQVDLLVMATHGYSGLRRWALGSVADKVIHTTTTPVLLVRAREEAA